MQGPQVQTGFQRELPVVTGQALGVRQLCIQTPVSTFHSLAGSLWIHHVYPAFRYSSLGTMVPTHEIFMELLRVCEQYQHSQSPVNISSSLLFSLHINICTWCWEDADKKREAINKMLPPFCFTLKRWPYQHLHSHTSLQSVRSLNIHLLSIYYVWHTVLSTGVEQ